jgi:hypothetical protein
MAVYHLIRSWWRARVRRLDLEILWPLCRAGAADLDSEILGKFKAAGAYDRLHAIADARIDNELELRRALSAPDVSVAELLIQAYLACPLKYRFQYVDHLPKAAGIPTTRDVLGYYAGQPKKLNKICAVLCFTIKFLCANIGNDCVKLFPGWCESLNARRFTPLQFCSRRL